MQQDIATTRSIEGKDGPAITVGLDVGDRYTHVCVLGSGGEVVSERRVRTTALALSGALGDLPPARVVLEAGPRSPWLSRVVADLGHEVVVANPRQVALIARSQRKTDRLDAAWLARLGRFDPELLAPIRHRSEQSQHHLAVVRARDALVRSRTLLINHVRGAVKACGAALPSCTAEAFHRKAAEAVRDLCRVREDAVTDRTRARHRLAKLLLRRGIAYDGRNWTLRHRRWLLTLRFEHPAAQATFDDYLRALEGVEERLRTLEQELAACAAGDDYREAVGLLRCFRGVDTVTAMTVLAELGDVTRFGSARQLMSYLGLTPSEHSSGARQRRGPITKAGNAHVRRLLVESAWHYRHPPRVGVALRKRREGQPGWAVALADRAQARLHRRHRRLIARGKPSVVANVAVARELAGCLWAVLRRIPASAGGPKAGAREQTAA